MEVLHQKNTERTFRSPPYTYTSLLPYLAERGVLAAPFPARYRAFIPPLFYRPIILSYSIFLLCYSSVQK